MLVTCLMGRVLRWLCGIGEYGMLEGLKQMKLEVWHLSEFYELVGMVCSIVDGL